MVLYQHDEFAADLEGDVVVPAHKQHVIKRVYVDRGIRRQADAAQSAVEFAQQHGVRKQQGEHAVFVLVVCFHIPIWVRICAALYRK